jgi:hypothetical protein
MSRSNHSVRPSRALRRQVRRCLQNGVTTVIGFKIMPGGWPTLLKGQQAETSADVKVYLWEAMLPNGQRINCVTDRPVRIEEEPCFPVLVEHIASAIQRGAAGGYLRISELPSGIRGVGFDGPRQLGDLAPLLGLGALLGQQMPSLEWGRYTQ